jgi:SPP1 gp7 family putative phage head morphogenesis protein
VAVEWDAIWRALGAYNSTLADILSGSVRRAYILGDVSASLSLGEDPNADAVRTASADFAHAYEQLLRDEGASIIRGEKVPWLADRTQQARDEITRIIEQGIKDGKPPGVTERVSGGYPEGTVAHDLEPFFDSKRSQASMVARTEMSRAINMGRLQRWQDKGYEYVMVHDNEGPHSCYACHLANGAIWTLEDAMSNEKEHPNCVRTFTAHKLQAGEAFAMPMRVDQGITWFSRSCEGARA